MNSSTKILENRLWIVVLGAPATDEGTLSPPLFRRCSKALECWESQPQQCVLLMGAAVLNEYAEADTMRNWLIEQGIPSDMIWYETETTTTREQAMLLTELSEKMNPKQIQVVSDCSHLPRTRLLLHWEGMDRNNVRFTPAELPKSAITIASQIAYELSATVKECLLHYKPTAK